MDFRRVFRKRLRVRRPGIDADSDVNVTVAANIGRRGGVTRVSSHQRATATAGTTGDPTERRSEPTDERPDGEDGGKDASDQTSSDDETGR
jgi:hypothetical protein